MTDSLSNSSATFSLAAGNSSCDPAAPGIETDTSMDDNAGSLVPCFEPQSLSPQTDDLVVIGTPPNRQVQPQTPIENSYGAIVQRRDRADSVLGLRAGRSGGATSSGQVVAVGTPRGRMVVKRPPSMDPSNRSRPPSAQRQRSEPPACIQVSEAYRTAAAATAANEELIQERDQYRRQAYHHAAQVQVLGSAMTQVITGYNEKELQLQKASEKVAQFSQQYEETKDYVTRLSQSYRAMANETQSQSAAARAKDDTIKELVDKCDYMAKVGSELERAYHDVSKENQTMIAQGKHVMSEGNRVHEELQSAESTIAGLRGTHTDQDRMRREYDGVVREKETVRGELRTMSDRYRSLELDLDSSRKEVSKLRHELGTYSSNSDDSVRKLRKELSDALEDMRREQGRHDSTKSTLRETQQELMVAQDKYEQAEQQLSQALENDYWADGDSDQPETFCIASNGGDDVPPPPAPYVGVSGSGGGTRKPDTNRPSAAAESEDGGKLSTSELHLFKKADKILKVPKFPQYTNLHEWESQMGHNLVAASICTDGKEVAWFKEARDAYYSLGYDKAFEKMSDSGGLRFVPMDRALVGLLYASAPDELKRKIVDKQNLPSVKIERL